MALQWHWDEKCGTATIQQNWDGGKAYDVNLYVGNAYLIMLYEWEEDGHNYWNMSNFWVDKTHMKRCLGLDKKGGYTDNLLNGQEQLMKIRLNKAKCRNAKEIIKALMDADFPELTIELYTEE